MDNRSRRANVATFRTDTDNRIVKAWISHDRERKSYRLTVVPVGVKVYDDGVVMHTVVAYSGFNGHVEAAPRYSRGKLDKLAQDPEVMDRVRELAFSLGAIVE